jgi:putative DNA primase/helicase
MKSDDATMLLSQLAEAIPGKVHIETDALAVKGWWARRSILELSSRAAQLAQAEGLPIGESVENVKAQIDAIAGSYQASLEFFDGAVHQGSTWAELAEIIGPIEWEWQSWLPRGFLTLVAGASGVGKSILLLRIAAVFLRGDPWPDGTPYTGDTGVICWCETEAAQALNLERAENWGLPVDRIISPLGSPMDDFDLDDTRHLAALARTAKRDDVRVIVIDSLSGGHRRDERKSNAMMGIVKNLAQVARDTEKPFMLSHHIRKAGLLDPTGEITLDMVRGSGAIVQLSRLVWGVDQPDPHTDAKRMSVVKSNLARFPEPIGLSIGDDGLIFVTAPAKPIQETQLQLCKDFLRDILDAGAMPVSDIEKELNGRGLSLATARRAKKALGIEHVKPKGPKVWVWQLPELSERFQ